LERCSQLEDFRLGLENSNTKFLEAIQSHSQVQLENEETIQSLTNDLSCLTDKMEKHSQCEETITELKTQLAAAIANVGKMD